VASNNSNNVITIDLSEAKSVSFVLTISDEEAASQVRFLDTNRDSHAVELRKEDERLYVKVTPHQVFIG
jgi:hypothetical protein